MAKKGRPEKFTAKKVLPKKEFQEFEKLKEQLAKRKKREELASLRQEAKSRRRIALRDASRTGKIGKGVSKFFQAGQRGFTRSLYNTPENRLTETGGIKTGKRGRPKGSYDKRYARFGGVYGYRKWLRTQLKIKRIQAQRDAQLTPRQEIALERLERQRKIAQMSPERRLFPDTYGNVPLSGIMDEIKRATNLVP